MLAGVLACTVESISYYPTVAQMCGAPPPPLHAINRGIGIEGFGTICESISSSFFRGYFFEVHNKLLVITIYILSGRFVGYWQRNKYVWRGKIPKYQYLKNYNYN